MRAVLSSLAAVAAAVVLAAPAAAQDSPPPPTPPPDDSAIAQYVEAVPVAAGTKAPGVGAHGKSRPLRAVTRTQLRASGGADTQALARLATSPELGAPARPKKPQISIVRPSEDRASAAGSFSAAVSAVGEGGGARFGILGLGLLAITAAMLGSTRNRIRARSS